MTGKLSAQAKLAATSQHTLAKRTSCSNSVPGRPSAATVCRSPPQPLSLRAKPASSSSAPPRRPAPDWLRSKLNSSCSDAGLAVPAAPSPAACAPHAEARQARALRLNSCQQARRLQTRAAAPAAGTARPGCTGAHQVPCGAGQGAGAGAPQPPDHPGPGLAPDSLFLVFSHTVLSSTVRHPSAHLVPTTNWKSYGMRLLLFSTAVWSASAHGAALVQAPAFTYSHPAAWARVQLIRVPAPPN